MKNFGTGFSFKPSFLSQENEYFFEPFANATNPTSPRTQPPPTVLCSLTWLATMPLSLSRELSLVIRPGVIRRFLLKTNRWVGINVFRWTPTLSVCVCVSVKYHNYAFLHPSPFCSFPSTLGPFAAPPPLCILCLCPPPVSFS